MIVISVHKMFFMKLHVKNMICQRCKIVVTEILSGFGLEAEHIQLGEIELKEKLSKTRLNQLNTALKKTGLELVFDHSVMLVQKIKSIIYELIHFHTEPLELKFSCYLSSRLNYNYTYLATVFKRANGISIERFMIAEKIEKVKTMLISEGATLNEIAYKMNYSSVAHLSAQFKKVTGIRASDFKIMRMNSYIRMTELIAV